MISDDVRFLELEPVQRVAGTGRKSNITTILAAQNVRPAAPNRAERRRREREARRAR